MRVFLSWSGSLSHEVAKAFSECLPTVLDGVDPWLSSRDILKGGTWLQAIREAIGQSGGIGIFFLTEESQTSPWLLFEAGAVSAFDKSQVCTVLIGLDQASSPLSQFQATRLEQDEICRLLQDINRRQSRPLEKDILLRRFQSAWPALDAAIKLALSESNVKRSPYPFPFPSLASGDREAAKVVSRKLISAVDRDLKLARYYRKNQIIEFEFSRVNSKAKLSITFQSELVPIDDVAQIRIPRIVEAPRGVIAHHSEYRLNGQKVTASETEIDEESSDEFFVSYILPEGFCEVSDDHLWPCPVLDYKVQFKGFDCDFEVSRLKSGKPDSLRLSSDTDGRKIFVSKSSAFTSQGLRWSIAPPSTSK